MDTLVLSKVGPRLIDFYRSDNRMTIAVNGPGMLFEKLELMTNRTALEGACIKACSTFKRWVENPFAH